MIKAVLRAMMLCGHWNTMYMGTATAPTSRSATAKLISSRLVRMRRSLELLRNTAMESEFPTMVNTARLLYRTDQVTRSEAEVGIVISSSKHRTIARNLQKMLNYKQIINAFHRLRFKHVVPNRTRNLRALSEDWINMTKGIINITGNE